MRLCRVVLSVLFGAMPYSRPLTSVVSLAGTRDAHRLSSVYPGSITVERRKWQNHTAAIATFLTHYAATLAIKARLMFVSFQLLKKIASYNGTPSRCGSPLSGEAYERFVISSANALS